MVLKVNKNPTSTKAAAQFSESLSPTSADKVAGTTGARSPAASSASAASGTTNESSSKLSSPLISSVQRRRGALRRAKRWAAVRQLAAAPVLVWCM
jgi:hypothetical protein